VLATGRYVGDGFDDRCLDTLLLAMPIAWTGTVIHLLAESVAIRLRPCR
jgi:hypothetical protein